MRRPVRDCLGSPRRRVDAGQGFQGGQSARVGDVYLDEAGTGDVDGGEAYVRLPPNQHSVQDAIPESTSRHDWTVKDLPLCWDAGDPAAACAIGADWLRTSSTALVVVPIIEAPLKGSVLINQVHPDASVIVVAPETPVHWDRGLFPQSQSPLFSPLPPTDAQAAALWRP